MALWGKMHYTVRLMIEFLWTRIRLNRMHPSSAVIYVINLMSLFESISAVFELLSRGMDSFARSDTCKTMLSRQNSTSEIARGLSHVLLDAATQSLPDNLEDLEDHDVC